VIAPANPTAYKPETKTQLLPAVVRSYPAVSGGRLFVRNENTLGAYSVGGAK
jgi:hypothetical protein